MTHPFSAPAGWDPALIRPADDQAMMHAALAIGRRCLGQAWPNPAVGAVIWKPTAQGPLVIARGFTRKTGRPHAEAEALRMAGEAARGAVMSVTLEPCSHHGKTPPCADAVIKAGLARVVTAIEDPDPRVAGRGHARMREAGIEVVAGVEARAAFLAHLGHIRRVTQHRPAVLLKLAQTADGYAAAEPGSRTQITGPIGSSRVHMERAEADAIMVGISTVLADDPQLNCRLPGMADHSPVRVVLDSDCRLPPASLLARTARQVPTWVLAATDSDSARHLALEQAGVEVLLVPRKNGRIDLGLALQALAARGVTRVMSEGGPQVADALANAGLIDEITLLTHMQPLGRQGLLAVGPHLRALLNDDTQFEAQSSAIYGEDRIDHFARLA
ncbi:MAG: bifunctional diaminohydroxyphosphoribosylaminopyrimidine deaminase/5-amino-6-(5-phosphoribosylamino)uracil reductase RibD [Hyphomicrobiales bacterium]|nr:bifunctional diaminohydroxyphosphoribosylaminopyrimidine deaminase/5-amino-6-(5-phosphoribosylamino)uracil reductase RibD [Hyphomicrobiales bacterium]